MNDEFRAAAFHLTRAAHHDQADSNRRQAYVLEQEAITGRRWCTRCLRLGHTRLGERECAEPWAAVPIGAGNKE